MPSLLEKVYYKNLKVVTDERGHFIECWRDDEYEFTPAMSYVSWTRSNFRRGPHQHENQWDCFIFPGPGLFDVYIWNPDNADEKRILHVGVDNPTVIIIPPGLVHGYWNRSLIDGLVINLPDQLYKGYQKKEDEDIIKYELEPNSPFKW